MLEPTDEMVDAYNEASWNNPQASHGAEFPNVQEGLAAVLAIVVRDHAIGPAMCDAPGHPTEPLAYCELPRGHRGTHSATVEKAVSW